jgi:hypothetical protein
MATTTEGLLKTFETAGDYEDKQFFIVWVANGVATLADDADVPGENIMGAIQNKPQAGTGQLVEVAMPHGGGTAKVKSGGSISAGDHLTTDANGEAIATTTSDDYVFGVALNDADDGDIFEYIPMYDIVD